MFWDMIFQGGYLVLNAVIAFITLGAEREGVVPPAWIKRLPIEKELLLWSVLLGLFLLRALIWPSRAFFQG